MNSRFILSFVLFTCFINLHKGFSQTISGTGGTAPCGDCTPTGWLDLAGTPDISNANNSGGQGSTGGLATWANAPLPLPPTGDSNWVTLRDVGPSYSEEAISTQMGSLISGKIYKLTLYTMTSLSNPNGGTGTVYYAGTYMDAFDYEIDNNGRQTISTITHDEWGDTYFYFLGAPNGSGEMTLSLYPRGEADFQNNGDAVDLEMIHVAVDLNALELLDSDNDGIDDTLDIDDDNDGIPDDDEYGAYDFEDDEDGDQLPNYLDTTDNGTGDGSTTVYTDSNGDGIPDIYDYDNDGVPNHLDLDADNDGIPDNIEAQSTLGYIAPSGSESGITDANNNGLDDNYETSQGGTDINPVNTDSGLTSDNPDFLDTDADEDGVSDTTEANLTISSGVGENGLYSVFDNGDNYADVNGFYDNTQSDNFIDADSDVNSGGDVDYRDTDQTGSGLDTDSDGIPDSTDIDDDNDGILDTTEGLGVCSATVLTATERVITDDGPATDNQNINLTSLNVFIGDIVLVDNIRARGDLNGTGETFTLSFNGANTTGNLATGVQCGSLAAVAPSVSQLVTVIDIGGGTPGITITANTLTAVDNSVGACNGVSLAYTVDIECNTTTATDTDSDGIPNYLDLDSDNDGIPDNIEAQPTVGYIAPSGSGTGITDGNNNGLDDNYETSQGGTNLTPPNTDSGNDSLADYIDTDSDNDGTSDQAEANLSLSGTVGINGLDNNIDNGDTYSDVNGNFDTTQTDNFPDADGDVLTTGDVDYRDINASFSDNDNDGVLDNVDLDDDNDGVLDTTESGSYDAEGDEDGDGILNYKDTSDGGGSGDGSTTDYTDANSDGIADVFDLDNDGVPNHFDLDSDGDAIPDNIEAQTTTGYIAFNTVINQTTGISEAYNQTTGITPTNTDGTDSPDYFDLDSDNDGLLDNTEANVIITGSVGNNGLVNTYDNGDNYTDVNGSFDNTQTDNFPDEDNDVNAGGDVNYRDDTFTYDNDDDDVNDEIDLDDDNDGVVDAIEYGTCTPGTTTFNWANLYTESSSQDISLGDDPISIDPTKTVDNMEVTLKRTSNVASDSDYRINDVISNDNYYYTLAQKARANAESTHIFIFDAPIYGLEFTLYDLDIDVTNTGIDEVEIIITKEDGSLYTLTASDYSISGSSSFASNTFTGTDTNNGNVTINALPEWIIKLKINYSNAGTGSIGGNQRIGIGNISFCNPIDTDSDGVFNFRDLDSDNDGIPDNIEAQSTAGYVAPTGTYSIFGIDVAYNNGVTPVNTDSSHPTNSDTIPDYLDLDADGDSVFDIVESGDGLADSGSDGDFDGTVGTNGLADSLETGSTDTGYTDVNGGGDNSITDNYTDTDGDVNTPNGDLDYRDISNGIDTDNDGIIDSIDIDDDNDGILDTEEDGSYNAQGDEDGDGILNYKDTTDNGTGDGSPTDYTDSNSDGIADVFDFDNDGISNHLDIDADNDGIPDNVEAQSTLGYIAPSGVESGITDGNSNGLDDNYETSQGGTDIGTPFNKDGTDNQDYLDTDSDNDGTPDIEENGDSDTVISGTDTDNDGLDDNFEGNDVSDGYDVNDEINTPQSDLPDVDSDVSTQDVDYRDDTDDPVTPGTAGNILWLRADIDVTGTTTVTQWDDQSSGGFIATSDTGTAPSKTTSGLNFNPALDFAGSDEDLIISGGILGNFSYTNLWSYVVFNPHTLQNSFTTFEGLNTGNYHVKIPDTNSSYRQRMGPTASIHVETITNLQNQFGLYTLGSTNTAGSAPSGSNQAISKNGLLIGTQNETISFVGINDNFDIGSNGSGNFLDGEIAEIIIFNETPSAIKQQSIESYLAIKYGFTLDITNNNLSIIEGDYVLADQTTKVWNYTTNSAYHNDVAGIGRDDAMVLNQKQSKSSNYDSESHITIGLGSIASDNASNGNSFATNKNFLMWGNNNISLTATTTGTLICAEERVMSRIWKVVENGTVPSTEIAIPESVINNALTTGYTARVMKVADDASFTTNVQYIPIVIGSGNTANQYVTNYNFNGTKYFTYAEVNGIFWNGDLNAWSGGAGTGNQASTELADTNKVMVVDSQTSLTHGVLSQDAQVECVWIKENSFLTVAEDKFLEFDEDFILDGSIKLVGDAHLLQTHTGQTNVQGNGKIYIDQKATVPNVYRYHYWSSPVVEVNKSTFRVGEVMKDGTTPTSTSSNENTPKDINFISEGVGYDGDTTNPITIANYWIWSYHNGDTQNDWTHKRNTGAIDRGHGYTMKSTGIANQNYTFVGTPNDGTIIIPVTADTNSLVGNPYPSALDAIDFINDNLNVINGTIYFWEHTGEDSTSGVTEGHNIGGYQGGYSTRNLAMGIAAQTPTDGVSGLGNGTYNPPGRYVAVGQSFYVGAHTSGNLIFENSHRNAQTVDGSNSIFLKEGKKKKRRANKTITDLDDQNQHLKLGFEYDNDSGVEIHRQIGVSFIDDLSFEFDAGYDSFIFDIQDDDIYWEFLGNNNKYVIAGIESFHTNLTIPLSVKINSNKTVKFFLDEKQNIAALVSLKDNLTGNIYELTGDTAASLNLSTGTYNDRFQLQFTNDGSEQLLFINSEIEKNFSFYFDSDSNILKIKNPNDVSIKNCKVISISGKTVKQISYKATPSKIDIKGLSKGIYIVRLNTSKGIITKKIAVY